MGREDAKDGRARQKVQLVLEVVLLPVIGRGHRRLAPHDPHEVKRANDEHALHDAVVDRNEAPAQVDVAQEKDDGVDLLGSARDADAALVLVQLIEQEHDARNVQHVAA
eukprot:CAMPEP_0203868918 /NCGR_PEP_ID=MMETSP0359-20131031/17401_1 /ASSEMBLY_ACC=CAM_ASM_000338 /TAXON_ID=268821 /ORGANISM="Scrippsiella Hangoei, Strain SHTV-5" /LENGTH=108 /DNA_ID=CAMNT_0050787441 /DNA_START=360 /DNA_END=686 /DNA_ORIENTATION=+